MAGVLEHGSRRQREGKTCVREKPICQSGPGCGNGCGTGSHLQQGQCRAAAVCENLGSQEYYRRLFCTQVLRRTHCDQRAFTIHSMARIDAADDGDGDLAKRIKWVECDVCAMSAHAHEEHKEIGSI